MPNLNSENPLNAFRRSIGSWVAAHQKVTYFLVVLLTIYGFFHFGLESNSWIVIFWRLGTVLVLLIVLSSPFEQKAEADVGHSVDEKPVEQAQEEKQPAEPLKSNGNDIEIIQALSDQFYRQSRRDTEKDFTQYLEKILVIVKETFGSDTAAIFLINQHSNEVVLKSFVSNSENKYSRTAFKPEQGLMNIILEKNSSYFSDEIENASDLLPYYDDPDAAESVIASPVLIDNEIIGFLVVDSKDRKAFSENDIPLLETYGGVIAETVINYNNLFEFENSTRLFSSFYEVSRGLNSNQKFDEIIDLLLDLLSNIFQYDRISISAYHSGDDLAEIIRVKGQTDDYPTGFKFPLDEGLNGVVISKKKPLIVPDMEKGDYFMPRFTRSEKSNYKLRSFIAAPITFHTSRVGNISIESREPNIYKERHERILIMLANNFGVALERSHVLEQLESLATTDELTGLNNRRSFMIRLKDEVARALRYKQKVSLLILDLDHFKQVNDTYGHLAGDLILRTVSKTIAESVRTIDFVCRYGGEEFAVILVETNLNEAIVSADRIRTGIEKLVSVYQKEELKVTVSIGVVEYNEDINKPKEFIRCADNALYRAKFNGRNRVVSYTEAELPASN